MVLNFNWKHNIDENAIELSNGNAVLFQIKKNLVWVQDLNALNRVLILQNRPWELSIFNQGLAIQVLYFWNIILIKTEVKTLLGNGLWKIITHSPMIHDPSMHNSCINYIFICMLKLYFSLHGKNSLTWGNTAGFDNYCLSHTYVCLLLLTYVWFLTCIHWDVCTFFPYDFLKVLKNFLVL